MPENPRPDSVGPTQDGFSALDQLRTLRTPSMSAIGQPTEDVVFPSFQRLADADRSQYAPQQGASYTQLRDEPQKMESSGASPVAFTVSLVGDNKVTVAYGVVRCVDPDSSAGSPVVDWVPTINGTPLSVGGTPEISVSAGRVLYCEVKTSNKGVVIEDPKIIVGDEFGTGTHYQPPQLNPTEGSLRYPLAKFEQDGDDLVVIQLQQGGPILVQPTLWEGRNVGGFRELYKERQNAGDYYEFRTLEQIDEESSDGGLEPIPVLKPAESGGEGDTIKVRFISQRPDEGSGSEGGEAQIKVTSTEGGGGIIVRGNSVNLTTSGSFVTSLPVKDGLVTGKPQTEPFGLITEVKIIDGCGSMMHVLGFRNGLLIGYEIVAVSA
jgi:hypothetical protein